MHTSILSKYRKQRRYTYTHTYTYPIYGQTSASGGFGDLAKLTMYIASAPHRPAKAGLSAPARDSDKVFVAGHAVSTLPRSIFRRAEKRLFR